MKTRVNDLEIIYNDKQEEQIEDIKRMISNNYNIINDCFKGNKTIDITDDSSNFEATFRYIMDMVFNSEDIRRLYLDKDFLGGIHVEAILRRNNIDSPIFEDKNEMKDDYISAIIAYQYFNENGTFDDFVNYLKVKDREDEIFNWLSEKERWETYNYVLEVLSNSLKSGDEEFFKQLNVVTSVYFSNAVDSFGILESDDYDKISREELDKLFNEYLDYIKAPDKWKEYYNYLKENELIDMIDNSDRDDSMCYADENGNLRIKLCYSDTIRGFCTLAHEFAHYVSMQDGLKADTYNLSEFPSIFFEKVAASFLTTKGYSNDVVNKVINDRAKNNYSLFFSMHFLFMDLIRFIDSGEVPKEAKYELNRRLLESINNNKRNMRKLLEENNIPFEPGDFEEINIDPVEQTNKETDETIKVFLEYGLEIMNGYQYLLDSYLVDEIIKNSNDHEELISKMINVTDNLYGFDVQDIVKNFNIEDSLKPEKVKRLVKGGKE